MKEKLNRWDWVLFMLAIAGAVVFGRLYHQVYPQAAIELPLSSKEITATGQDFIKKLGYSYQGYEQEIHCSQDQNQVTYLGQEYGLPTAFRLMQDSIPATYWRIRWKKPAELNSITITASNNEPPQATVDQKVHESFSIDLSVTGQILAFNLNVADSVQGANLADSVAFGLAKKFLEETAGINLVGFEEAPPTSKKLPGRTDYTFKWRSQQPLAGEYVEHVVSLYGERIAGYKINFQIPEKFFSGKDNSSDIRAIFSVSIFLIYAVLIIVLLIKKLKGDRLDLQVGLIFGIVVAIALIIIIGTGRSNENWLEQILALVLPPLLLGFVIVVIFAVADAVTREVWPEKLYTYDAFRKRYILFPRFGNALLRGIAVGLFFLGLLTGFYFLGNKFFGIVPRLDETRISQLTAFSPFLFVLGNILIGVLFREVTFRLLTISYLRKHLKKLWAIVIISGALSALSIEVLYSVHSNSDLFDLGLLFLFAMGLALVLIRFDLITVLVTNFTMQVLFEGYTFLQFQQTEFTPDALFAGFVPASLLMIALVGKVRKIKREVDLTQLAPPYVAKMTEQERLKRELEIARHVQLSFLPKRNPQMAGVDVATICIPAREVGGDYYDFVQLNQHRLGIVIGDVSGKGISAAFYMTLMKGLLKSQARDGISPRQVLIQLNQLFYENVERGTFISMIYGVFDLREQTFTFARAGHNPIIIRHGPDKTAESLLPKGLALGLEAGLVFEQVIEEWKIGIKENDLFIFYTDGFSEAMNKQKEEFGEQQLADIVNNHYELSAELLLGVIRREVEQFVGRAPQHDDMTMVILKIRGE